MPMTHYSACNQGACDCSMHESEAVDAAAVPLLVAIGRVGESGTHSGLAVNEGPASPARLIDLAFHKTVRSVELPAKYKLYPLHGDVERMEIAADVITLISNESRDSVPYGFSIPGPYFDAVTGQYLATDIVGLTCSTFVIAALESVGLSVVDISTWRERANDGKRFAELVQLLRDHGVHPAHVKLVEDEDPAFRIRPEDLPRAAYIFSEFRRCAAFDEVSYCSDVMRGLNRPEQPTARVPLSSASHPLPITAQSLPAEGSASVIHTCPNTALTTTTSPHFPPQPTSSKPWPTFFHSKRCSQSQVPLTNR